MQVLVVIPARYASTRFPGKPLVDIKGKPMIQHVYERVSQCNFISKVIIATDDERIMDAAEKFSSPAMMTSSSHQSGSDRCAEVVKSLSDKYDIVINVQGDEPFIDQTQLFSIIRCFENPETEIATLVKKVQSSEELFNPNVVKVALNELKEALYFSRAAIPFNRNHSMESWMEHHTYYKHIGIYAFKPQILLKLTRLKHSSLEIAESLEQLRWLENGFKIKTEITEKENFAIDTPQDLEKLLNII
jgi:3-deoxy-manno-octulosonate cytidylyltransferase (CMP-KDO synthetase)